MKKDILIGLAWAVGMITVSLAASALRKQGYIDQDTMLRVVAMNGLMVAYYGNLAPKMVVPNARARQVNRFAGWSLALGGLVYAGFWAFAPLPLAKIAGTGALAAALILTLVYCLWLRGRAGKHAGSV